MDIRKKLSDFIKLEEAQGNVTRLATLGAATVSSLLVSGLLASTAAAANCHSDSYGDQHNDSDPWYWFHSDSYTELYHDDLYSVC